MLAVTRSHKGLLPRTHPYARVYCTVVLALAAALADSPLRLSLVGAAVAVLAIAAQVSWRRCFLGVVPVVSLAAGLFLVSLIGGMTVAEVRLEATTLFLGRCYLAFIAVSALFVSTDPVDVIQAFEVLRVPVLLTAVAGSIFRWFHQLGLESRRMNTARVLRGGDLRGRVAQLASVTNLSTSLMVRSYIRAERVAAAMECRGFQGKLSRSAARKLRAADLSLVLAACAYVALVWVVTR